MFNYQRDKTGFFATLILLFLMLGVVVSTTVLIAVGAAQGDWKAHLLAWKWVVAGCWLGCIVTVLVRVIIFRQQMQRAERRAAEQARFKEAEDVVQQK